MGVITTADEHRRRAGEYLEKIDFSNLANIEYELKKMIDLDVWGGDDWSKDFVKKVREDIKTIQKIERKIQDLKRKY